VSAYVGGSTGQGRRDALSVQRACALPAALFTHSHRKEPSIRDGDSCLLSRPHCISFQSTALVFFDSHRHSPTLWDAHCPAGTDKSDRIVK
jgi:hypothetical protein